MYQSRTINLIDRFLRLYEQDEQEPQQAPEQEPPANPVDEVDENTKYIIKLLTNAFIFNPNSFDESTRNRILKDIESLKQSINQPVASVVDKIKRILAYDKSLVVESLTISLINRFLEQVEDATEAPPAEPEAQLAPKPSVNKLQLQEVFPRYRDLIVRSLTHEPTDEELSILTTVVDEFADIDPERILVTIQKLLDQTQGDQEVEKGLSSI